MIFRLLIPLLSVVTFLYSDVNHKVISCEPTLIYQCSEYECSKVDIVNIDGVQYFEVDTINNTLIGKIGRTEVNLENILSQKRQGESYVFFGTHADSAYDWILRINKSGNMTLAGIEGEDKSFSIYGKCKWKETE